MANMRPGDWHCAQCGNHNFASRTVCNKCGAAKVGPSSKSSAPTAAQPSVWSPFAQAQAASWALNFAGGCGFGAAKGGAAKNARINPYVAGLVGGASAGPVVTPMQEVRAGDWFCGACGNHNYADKVVCNKCGAPKTGMPGMMPMFGMWNGGAATNAKGSMRPGDWICSACNNHNYASKTACNKCGAPKETGTVVKTGDMRAGDWMCSACGNHNYADKIVCNKCGAPKETGTVTYANMREGDWLCPSCNNHNYADKVNCNRCGAPKP